MQPARAQAVLPARVTISMPLLASGSASRTCSDGVSHTCPDVASPASVTVRSIIDRGTRPCAHSGTAAIVQLGRVQVSIASLASDGGSKLLVELHHSASLLLPSLLAVLSVTTASHEHVAITAELQSPLLKNHSAVFCHRKTSLISDVCNIMRDSSMCKTTHAHHKHS